MSDRLFVVNASGFVPGVLDDGSVAIRFRGLGQPLGMAEDLSIVLSLSPDESRSLAELLKRLADEAEARSPQPPIRIQEPPGSVQ